MYEVEINKTTFEKICALQSSKKEIIDTFLCTEKFINEWCNKTYKMTFDEVYKKIAAKGKIQIRNIQFKQAERSAAMAIYLGKVYLNQREAEKKENDE